MSAAAPLSAVTVAMRMLLHAQAAQRLIDGIARYPDCESGLRRCADLHLTRLAELTAELQGRGQ